MNIEFSSCYCIKSSSWWTTKYSYIWVNYLITVLLKLQNNFTNSITEKNYALGNKKNP